MTLPALRRRSDCATLIRRVFAEEAAQAGTSAIPDESVIAGLAAYFWPGNLRELRHVARFAVALAEGRSNVICQEHLPPALGHSGEPGSQAQIPNMSPETESLRLALQRVGWNITAAARLLNISRATLHRKIRKSGLQRH